MGEYAMQPAIRVENLGKCYRVAHNEQRGGYHTLRDSLVNAVKAPFRRMMIGGESAKAEDFWALNDVSFEVQPGEVVGTLGATGPARARCSRSCLGSQSRRKGGSNSMAASAACWKSVPDFIPN